jgi:hypothetical protein
MYMKRIGRRSRRGIDIAIGCADDELPVGPQYASNLAKEFVLLVEMLDSFE